MHKRWIKKQFDPSIASHLENTLKIHPIFCRLLSQRGIKTFQEAKEFFRPNLNKLHDPFLMKDMEKAVDRLLYAKKRNQKILIYGDYDVDGTTSVALVYSFLKDYFDH